jgi:hypothetical protein
MHKIPNSPNVVLQRLGKGQGFSHQSRHPLPQRIVESLDVAGLACFFSHCSMAFAGVELPHRLPKVRVGDRYSCKNYTLVSDRSMRKPSYTQVQNLFNDKAIAILVKATQ